MVTTQTFVTVPVQPWFKDHFFNGRMILPAVETLLLLASETAKGYPDVDIRTMESVQFPKFLEIVPDQSTFPALIEFKPQTDGSVQATFFSRVKLKSFTKLQAHGKTTFPLSNAATHPIVPALKIFAGAPTAKVDTEKIYQELVPFGPAYRTLTGFLSLYERGATGTLAAPALSPEAVLLQQDIGSPFPLDGAMHAACVYGQSHCDFIPFPVGFARRVIAKPTRPCCGYNIQIELMHRADDEFIFNIWIFNDNHEIYEAISGVRMRDVSGATMKPPDWIRSLS